MINLYNEDCLQAMLRMDTDQYDLAIVDPPYGIKINKSGRLGHYGGKKNWDSTIPTKEYFLELFRVSKNQIIWGANYFLDYLHNTKCFIIWDKKQPHNISFASSELAWASFNKVVKTFYLFPVNADKNRIHPTQKPVALYKWILNNYAKEGDKILDTHLGSGSIAIACHDMGFSLDGYELDTEYYEAACKRLKEHQRQLKLF